MKFRKKPVVIDAVQWLPGTRVHGVVDHGAWGAIETLEGTMRVDSGDWVITGVKGEKYPCKPDIFAATYEPADVQPDGIAALEAENAKLRTEMATEYWHKVRDDNTALRAEVARLPVLGRHLGPQLRVLGLQGGDTVGLYVGRLV